jgi:hypothetical protein
VTGEELREEAIAIMRAVVDREPVTVERFEAFWRSYLEQTPAGRDLLHIIDETPFKTGRILSLCARVVEDELRF